MSEGLSLQEYVRETLLAIAGGVRDAQTDGDLGELIGRAPLTDLGSFARDLQGNTVTKVDFDVATTVEEKSSGGVGGSVKVIALGGLEAGGKRESLASAVSRVAFSVSIAVPRPAAQASADEARQQRDTSRIQSRRAY